jgi:hypothetical protein
MELTLSDGHHAMDWLEWSSAIVRAVAWPLAAVAISLIFRGQLGGLLTRLQKLTWGDKEASFAERLDELEEVAEERIVLRGDPAQTIGSLTQDRFETLLAISPEAAILDAWHPIEQMIDELYDADHSEATVTPPLMGKITELIQRNGLPRSVRDTIRGLRELRNRAAHGVGLTPADAYRFRSLSRWLLSTLENHYTKKPPHEEL